jgi:hypothetical protein
MLQPDRLVKALRRSPRLAVAVAAALVVVIACGAFLLEVGARPAADPAAGAGSPIALASSPTPTASPTAVPPTPSPLPSVTPGSYPGFPPIQLFVPANPDGSGDLVRPVFWVDQRRPIPVQSLDWLALKASGRIALVNGQFTVLPAGADPLVVPGTGASVPARALMDTSWTRWVVEVPGSGQDEKGNWFSNLSYWEFCGDGAMTVALWYWQQRTGHPDVTGTAGYFLDPYAAEGVAWPSPGPQIATRNGTPIGTYWSGSDDVSGFTAHGRGFEFYLAMAAQPIGWQSTGFTLFALDGKPLYPALGTPLSNIQAGLNWEASGHSLGNWSETYYTLVTPQDPSLARDLAAAVTIDVGRDQVPVVALVDTYDLPNWQNGDATPHIRHAIAIVGYDNTANPPTFTYTETCGRACNRRGGNQNGQIHVIAQSELVKAIQDKVGSGFVW